MRFWIGGYDRDIRSAWLDAKAGTIELGQGYRTPENGSWITWRPGTATLYAAVETGSAEAGGGLIAAFRASDDGGLVPLGTAASCGSGPCHLEIDPSGRFLAAANYGGGNFVVLEVRSDGAPGAALACVRHEGSSVHPERQDRAYPHAAVFSPDGRYLFVCDLGADRVMRYPVDALAAGRGSGETAAAVHPGSGPRHLAFSADARFAYLVNELSSDIVVYRFEPSSGVLGPVQTVGALPDGFDGRSTAAEIAVHPGGRYLYASNRGHDSLAVFARDPVAGTLRPLAHVPCGGKTPRHFAFDPSGRWCLVANQDSDSVALFGVDGATGGLEPTGSQAAVRGPSCVAFLT